MNKILVANNVDFNNIDIGTKKLKSFPKYTRFVVIIAYCDTALIKKAGRGNNAEFLCDLSFLNICGYHGVSNKPVNELSGVDILRFVSTT